MFMIIVLFFTVCRRPSDPDKIPDPLDTIDIGDTTEAADKLKWIEVPDPDKIKELEDFPEPEQIPEPEELPEPNELPDIEETPEFK